MLLAGDGWAEDHHDIELQDEQGQVLARAAARRKISQLEEAVEGAEFFTDDHAALPAKVLARTGPPSAGLEDLTAVIERLLAPYEEQLQQRWEQR